MAKVEYIRIMTVSEREKLYREIWSDPMTIVAPRYGISNVQLRNRCLKLEIPLPPMGYWKMKKGKESIPIPSLKSISEENRKYVSNFKVDYVISNKVINGKKMEVLTQDSQKDIREYCTYLLNIETTEEFHLQVKKHIQYILEMDRVINFSGQDEFIGSVIGKLVSIGRIKKASQDEIKLLPIKVSKANRERAYRIMNALLKVIEDYQGELKLDNEFKVYENRVNDFARYGIGCPIYIDILDICMEFMLEEKVENSLMLWFKVVAAKEIDKRLEFKCRQIWYCIEDTEERCVEEQLADLLMVLVTWVHFFKGKRGSYLRAKGIHS